MAQRIEAGKLRSFATAVLQRVGLEPEKAATVAEILLEGDLMGHTTHGLQLLTPYVNDAAEGRMTVTGEPEVLADHAGSLLWDGRYLPGPWLVARAMDRVFQKAESQGSATAVIRRSHHIGALAAYMKRATDRGLACALMCSDPANATVAPHGARTGVYSPNPIAAGWPTARGPVWIDVSSSTTANGIVARLNRVGGRLPGPWLIDEQGKATDDPAAMAGGRKGAVLPLGGMDLGYKGFALGLIVEAFTSALGGFGRADGEKRWGASVFLLAMDPRAFGGTAAFEREAGWLAEASAAAGARMPGQRAAALREKQLKEGVELHPEILPALTALAAKYVLEAPA